MWRHFRYCTQLDHTTPDVELGVVDHFESHTSDRISRISPTHPVHCPSNRLLPVLLDAAREGNDCIRFGHRLAEFTEYRDGVQATVQGKNRSYNVRCQYLVGCDGAASSVRQKMGIALHGKQGMQHLINVHFHSPTLAAALRNNPGMLYFVFNPDVIAVLVAHDLQVTAAFLFSFRLFFLFFLFFSLPFLFLPPSLPPSLTHTHTHYTYARAR